MARAKSAAVKVAYISNADGTASPPFEINPVEMDYTPKHGVLVELETSQGSAWVDPKRVCIVGAPFQIKPVGRPKSTKRMTDEQIAEMEAEDEARPFMRVVFTEGGHKLYILDTQENLAALGL